MELRLRAAVRGLAPLALLAIAQCALLFPTQGLDNQYDAGEAGSNLVDGRAGDGRADGAPDVGADVEAGDGPETAQEAGDDGPGDDQGLDAPETSLDAEAGADAPPACPGGPTGDVVFTFDTTDSTRGWDVNTAASAPPHWTGTEGKACLGALYMQANFAGYDGQGPALEFTYGAGASWSSTSSQLHAWVKLVPLVDAGVDGFATLGSVGIFVRSHNNSSYSFYSVNVSPSLADSAWHELVIDLTVPDGGPSGRMGPDVDRTSIQAFGVFVSSAMSKPSGGPPTPPSVDLFLDDVFLQ